MQTDRRTIVSALALLLAFVPACETPTDAGTREGPAEGLRLAGAPERVDVCHRTSSETNPWVLITVSERAVQKHLDRHGDAIPHETEIDGTVLDETCTPVPTGGPGECPVGTDNCAGHTTGPGSGGGGETAPDPF